MIFLRNSHDGLLRSVSSNFLRRATSEPHFSVLRPFIQCDGWLATRATESAIHIAGSEIAEIAGI